MPVRRQQRWADIDATLAALAACVSDRNTEEKPKDSTRLKTPIPTPSLKSDAQERVFEQGGKESDDQLELILMQEPDASVVDVYLVAMTSFSWPTR